MREQVVKTMQERGIKELPMFKSYQEWGKEQDYKPDDYEEDESDDKDYLNYRDEEAPYAIFFDKYGCGYDYRVDKVTLKQNALDIPVLEFDCYANEIGSDTFGENDLVFLTLYNVYDTILDLLGIEDEPKDYFEITSVSREDLEEAGFDTSDVDDATMELLASKMANDYCEQLFWVQLPIIAEYLEIPKKENNENQEEDEL